MSSLDLAAAMQTELTSRIRLLPKRLDYAALAERPDQVRKWIEGQTKLTNWGGQADIVLAEKVHGTRPLAVMTLQDRTIYRALVERLATQLPNDLTHREPIAEFHRAPLEEVPEAAYITKTDIASYYVYIDHGVLLDELTSQTGDYEAAEDLVSLLGKVMGRTIGIPQVSTASDVLGDTYLDRARRNLIRQGLSVYRYADDFRLTASTLSDARHDLDTCGAEVFRLGLTLSDTKTLTHRRQTYEQSLNKFRDAEKRLFESSSAQDEDLGEDDAWSAGLTLLLDSYEDAETDEDGDDQEEDGGDGTEAHGVVDEVNAPEGGSLDDTPPQAIDDVETVVSDAPGTTVNEARIKAAARAWALWDRSSLKPFGHADPREPEDHAVIRGLLGRALPVLGHAGDTEPLQELKRLLESEPALTPQICAYLENLAGTDARDQGLDGLDSLLSGEIALSSWQKMWIASALGAYGAANPEVSNPQPHRTWLHAQLQSDSSCVTATALAALAQLGDNTVGRDVLAQAVNRVVAPWRTLALWGVAHLDREQADRCKVDGLDAILLEALKDQ